MIPSVESSRVEVKVNKIHCQGCVERIQNGLSRFDGVLKVEVSKVASRVAVEFNPQQTNADHISKVIEEIGYVPSNILVSSQSVAAVKAPANPIAAVHPHSLKKIWFWILKKIGF